jgi:hypothetical protein
VESSIVLLVKLDLLEGSQKCFNVLCKRDILARVIGLGLMFNSEETLSVSLFGRVNLFLRSEFLFTLLASLLKF